MDREVLERVKARLDGLVEELLGSAGAPRTIDEVEAAALKLREKAGQLVTEELGQAAEEQAQREAGDPKKVECACGRWARSRGCRERDVVLLSGRLRVRRRYYYCRRCDRGFCLTDRALGLCAGPFTRRVVQEVVRLDALLPYQKAVELLFELSGVWVSAKEAQRMLERAGVVVGSFQEARWGQAAQDGLSGKAALDVLYLLADGVQTPIVGGWRETKIGVARGMDACGRRPAASRYVSLLGEAEPFGWEWAALAEGAGITHARLVAVLADGAKWIWNQAELHFPQAIQILDVWHATERLWEVGRLAFGGEEAKVKEWMKPRQAELWEYRTDALLEALHQVAERFEGAREKAQEAIGYFTNNRDRMDYPRYQKLGLQIGSGAVESACKQVVTQRLKGAGMRWKEAGAQTMARLRCLLLGGEWHAFICHWNQTAPALAI